MIEYNADYAGNRDARSYLSGTAEVLAIEASVLVNHIYDYMKSESEEDAEVFLSLVNGFINNSGRPMYEVVSHGES